MSTLIPKNVIQELPSSLEYSIGTPMDSKVDVKMFFLNESLVYGISNHDVVIQVVKAMDYSLG